jgi:hypothetical protein
MRFYEINRILRWLFPNEDGSYSKEELLQAIQYAYDIGFKEGENHD